LDRSSKGDKKGKGSLPTMNIEEIVQSSLNSASESLQDAAAQAGSKMAAEANSAFGFNGVPGGGNPEGQSAESPVRQADADNISVSSIAQTALGQVMEGVKSLDVFPINDATIISLIDNRGSSASFDNRVAHALKDFPSPLLELAKKSNLSVATAPYFTDIAPELKNKQPPGYDKDSTWKDVPAAVQQHSDSALIGLSEENLGTDKRKIKSAVAHELGHVIDKQLKPVLSFKLGAIELSLDLPPKASDSPDFQLAYYRDLAKLK